MNIEQFNLLPQPQAFSALESCCVAKNWVDAMLDLRPFADLPALYQSAESIWEKCAEADYLAAFEGHPRIGDVATLKAKYQHTAGMAGHEQQGMSQADEQLLHRMKQRNDDYFDKFGFIFIVCASGKSAQEMLEILESRIGNDYKTELAIAANEQMKITQIRLEKLFIAE